MNYKSSSYFLFFKDFFIYLTERVCTHKQGELQAEGEGEAGSPAEQGAGSQTQDLVSGPRDHDLRQRQTQPTEPPRRP